MQEHPGHHHEHDQHHHHGAPPPVHDHEVMRPPPPAAAVAGDAIYTCPMHPEVRQVGPGSCPICGMALEPLVVTAEERPDPELVSMTRRFWVSLVFTAPLFALVMIDMLFDHAISGVLTHRGRVFAELALAAPVCTWAAWPFYERAVRSVRNRSLNMFTLIGLGVSVAFGYSLVAAIAPGIFPAAFREGGEVGTYFEAAAVIVTLILLGQVLELRARGRTSAAIRALLGLAPSPARRSRSTASSIALVPRST
ncbi:MAG: hypothetical protein K8M05_05020, partial [Deltaproteobacteria bacterium]|nr:hypothetical protein [Kofleriaceae bacterium]